MGWETDEGEAVDVMAGFDETEAIDTEGETLARVEAPELAPPKQVPGGLRVRPLSPSMAARPHVISGLVTTTSGQVLYHRGVR